MVERLESRVRIEKGSRRDREKRERDKRELKELHHLSLLVVQALRYSSGDMSSQLDSEVKRCSSEVISLQLLGKGSGPMRLVKY